MPDAASPAASSSQSTSGQSLDPNFQPSAAAASPAAQQTDGYWAKEFLKPDGSLNPSVFDKAPEEYRGMGKEIGLYKNLDDFLKSHKGLRELSSKKGLVEPLPQNATKEQIAERDALLRKVNGVPEKPEDYGLTKPQDLPDNLWDQDYANAMAKAAHDAGASPSVIQALAKAEIEHTKAVFADQQKQQAEWLQKQDDLFREFSGKEGLTYDQAAQFAERAGKKFGVDASNPLWKNASFRLAMSRVGKAIGEDKLVTGETEKLTDMANMSPDAAGKAADDICHNKDNADYWTYWNRQKDKDSPRPKQSDVDAIRKKVNDLRVIQARGAKAR